MTAQLICVNYEGDHNNKKNVVMLAIHFMRIGQPKKAGPSHCWLFSRSYFCSQRRRNIL